MLEHRTSSAFQARVLALPLSVAVVFTLAACRTGQTAEKGPAPEPVEQVEATDVILASTTSTEDSGLFSELVPAFQDAYPQYRLSVVAVGTGQALEIGRNKDADVLLVHAESQEEAFVAQGFGVERVDVMYNDFVIVGPDADPAAIAGSADAVAALTALSDGGYTFVSRGDESGTHSKELQLWEAAGIEPGDDWYLSTGQGMGGALTMASELEAYTLADRGTYLAMRDRLELVVAVEGDEALFNPYGVIVVTDSNNTQGARAFVDWIVSPAGQAIIETFGVDTYGEPLFVPNATE